MSLSTVEISTILNDIFNSLSNFTLLSPVTYISKHSGFWIIGGERDAGVQEGLEGFRLF